MAAITIAKKTEQPTVDLSDIATFLDLHHDKELARKLDDFNTRLNVPPPASWIKKNPFANNSEYLPIDKTELLMDTIFQDWEVEVRREGVMFNSVYCTVRVKYWHPILNKWRHHDGVGAHNMQKDANPDGSKVTLSLETIKDAAVKMALPIAKSEAVKDACDHIGRIFGRDLNRKNVGEWKTAYSPVDKPKPIDKSDNRLLLMIYNCTSIEALQKLKKDCVTEEHIESYDDMLKKLMRK